MSPKKRNKENKPLPAGWRYRYGAYYYRVPSGSEPHWDGKSEFRLAKTLHEAHQVFSSRIGYQDNVDTLAQLCDRYSIEVVPLKAPATRKSNNYSIKRIRKAFAENPVTAIQPTHIYQYKDFIGKSESQKKANLDLEVLSHMLTKAVEWGVVPRNVMANKGVVKFRLTARSNEVDTTELMNFAATLPRRLQLFISLALWTGRRKGELLRMTRFDVLEDGLAFTNNKPPYNRFTLEWEPETRAIIEELLSLPTYGGTHLFPTRNGEPYIKTDGDCSGFDSIWQRRMQAAKKEGIVKKGFTVHDLRKVRASSLTLQQAQELLQHTTPNMTKTYRVGSSIVKMSDKR
jgi:integrase